MLRQGVSCLRMSALCSVQVMASKAATSLCWYESGAMEMVLG